MTRTDYACSSSEDEVTKVSKDQSSRSQDRSDRGYPSESWRLSALILTPRREIPLMDSIKHPAFHSFVTGSPPRYPKADLSQNFSKS